MQPAPPAAPATAPTASAAAPVAPTGESIPPSPPATLSDDAKTARKEFADAAGKYVFLAHKDAPHDPLPWQLLRLALWGKVTALPPSENGQTFLQPPDPVRLAALHNLLESGKPLEAALGAEDLFAASLFCLDAQAVADEALGRLGPDYAQARERVREETSRFVRRLGGVEALSFTDGTPFATPGTQDWLRTLEPQTPSDGARTVVLSSPAAIAAPNDAPAEAIARAESLFATNGVGAALESLENAQGTSSAVNMALRVGQLRLLCRAGETAVAAALARDLLNEVDRRELEHWDSSRAVDALLAVRDAFALARDGDGATAVHGRIARLRPSAAIGWQH